MKTIDVKFQGKDYKIRRNMYTMHLFQNELKKAGEVSDIVSTMIFSYCALKGYNKDFNDSLDTVMMHIDDEDNISVLDGIAELFKSEVEEKEEGESKEKK